MNLLIVDDNKTTAHALGKLLKEDGYEVEIAYDGDMALTMAQDSKPDAIILDIALPEKDGYQVARLLREKLLFPALLIALTGYGQREDKIKAQAAGFDYHLTKPILASEIEALLKAHGPRVEKEFSLG